MREKDLVKQQFGKNSQSYVTSTTHGNEADVANLVQLLKPMPNGLALDIATGGGHVAKQLAKFVDRVVAADLSEAMLANTAKHLADLPNIDYIIADAEQLPFLTDSFDIVTCRIAAHHFPIRINLLLRFAVCSSLKENFC
ncbi:class I SAM-dependent methyltransferase [Virgibacillus sp. 179-BFC.A HS]|uniref:Class I SAM-dependent methyltransferase n=1 Tax=Tigheibacillus jepli TaxID=3035914 RepID=A0ABU5CKC1_9BACI|nr:class I SAM-dependent methyltransferase [Virgibacillus sp. 179-BFC.A HS]MDY0405940.1 class I SAM-dependent methyltransferase [Virgibacillus sp. 179-BFC.A HS]